MIIPEVAIFASDLAWVKDPLPYVQDNPGCDLIMADGQTYVSEFLRRWRPTVNAGFYYARNTPNTKEFFEVRLLVHLVISP